MVPWAPSLHTKQHLHHFSGLSIAHNHNQQTCRQTTLPYSVHSNRLQCSLTVQKLHIPEAIHNISYLIQKLPTWRKTVQQLFFRWSRWHIWRWRRLYIKQICMIYNKIVTFYYQQPKCPCTDHNMTTQQHVVNLSLYCIVLMEILMQLWRPEFELDGINSESWCHCLPIRMYHWSWEGGCTAVVCKWHRSDTWHVRKENEVTLQQAETKMVRWMCDIMVKHRFPSDKLKEIRK